jgi:hypothetical protein
MKDPVNYFFGIYNVYVWVKRWTVMIISGDTNDGDMCISVRNGHYENNNMVVAQACVDAIAIADHREIFEI